jgi:hypothetical protein
LERQKIIDGREIDEPFVDSPIGKMLAYIDVAILLE